MITTTQLQYVRGKGRRRDSWHTKSGYAQGLEKFNEFIQEVYGHSEEKEIQLIKDSQLKGDGRVYRTLDGFVGWMSDRQLKPRPISLYYVSVRGYLINQDVDINKEKLRERVVIPMKNPIAEKPLKPKDIPDIVNKLTQGKIDPRLKALIFLLFSSGIRLQEALTLHWRECELDGSPPRVLLAGQSTKSGQPREAYMTRQAAEELKLLHRRRGPDDYVFDFMEGKTPDPTGKQVQLLGVEGYRKYMAEKKAGQMFRRLVKNVELDEKIEGHRFHTIRFHIFRKYFYVIASNEVGPDLAHLLMGHTPYMGMYDIASMEKVRNTYMEELEKSFTIGEAHHNEDVDGLKERVSTLEAELKELRAGAFNALKQLSFEEEIRRREGQKMTEKGHITEADRVAIIEEVYREAFPISEVIRKIREKRPGVKIYRTNEPISDSPVSESQLEEITGED